ncbi:MAG TPA: efflux RND transporter permease subunit [Verrucomicrobiae bacterium]|nr:efflux RND transporter permease subunit [Verrucomicrobiae bacterium]
MKAEGRRQKAEENLFGLAGRIAHAFIDSKLTPLVIIASLLLGVFAVLMLPREEEPQIKVPMIDVMVAMPGAGAKEVEQRVTVPMEKLLWEIPGVEYIYSTSKPGESLVIVRFKVGEDVEKSLVRLTEKLRSNYDRIPQGVTTPLIKAWSIDDVPILTLTFHSNHYNHFMLRRLVAQVDDAVKQVPLVAQTMIIGGDRREVRVLLDPAKLASRNLSAADIVPMLTQANRQVIAGGLTSHNQDITIETGGFLANAREVGDVVVGVFDNKPVYLRDVAQIKDGPAEPSQYVFFGNGAATSGAGVSPAGSGGVRAANENTEPGGSVNPQAGRLRYDEQPAVTLTVAKRPGANAISVVGEVLKKVDTLKGRVIPNDVQVTVTRNYGRTAEEKSNELLFHMGIAVIGVSVLILLALGWREAGIVAIAIPCTLALTLLVFYLYGYTLNRITLFALIFSIGILVDDAIVVVENIVRHFHLPQNKDRSWPAVAVEAVNEVGNPTILATFAVIAAVLPMAFVGGLMGPYMRPIPIGSSAAMAFSLAIAFIVTPWASIRILHWKRRSRGDEAPTEKAEGENKTEPPHVGSYRENLFSRVYLRLMRPLIEHRKWRYLFLAGVTTLLLLSMALVGLGWVKVKMLPFDNKSEFQTILNMPEGSSLERTAQCAREMAAAVRTEPEVANYQIYVGTAAPFNFNGLVRHYFLRRGANVADLQINLLPKSERQAQSHEIAKRVRPEVAAIAAKYGARVAVAEVPPGPPVLQTLVAEIYGPTEKDRLALAEKVIDIFHHTPGVVDTDWYFETNPPATRFVVDKEKAALAGISAETIAETLRIAVGGEKVGLLHVPRDKEDVDIVLQLPRDERSSPEQLLALRVRSAANPSAPLVPLSELVHAEHTTVDNSIYHKNLMPVTYVVGDVAGSIESPVYAILKMNPALRKLDTREFGDNGTPLKILNYNMPFTENQPVLKWDGEWHITIEVFRDLGMAFAAVLVLIYILMVGWFRSFLTPLIVMVVIPFSLIGIMPAHGILHAFFTATSMIGFMAGAGIVVRNSIILVDFIEMRLGEGHPLADAVVEAGMVRFRPIMLTALAVVVGATVILADPIFQGLAISLMAGSLVSMFTAPVLVPLLYFIAFKSRKQKRQSAP